MIVTYVGAHDVVHVPGAGVSVARGRAVEVPDDVAGREPGDWTAVEFVVDDGRAYRVEGSAVLAMDLGAGLLAQEDVWRRGGVIGDDAGED